MNGVLPQLVTSHSRTKGAAGHWQIQNYSNRHREDCGNEEEEDVCFHLSKDFPVGIEI